MMEHKYRVIWIYILIDPRNYKIRYVGQTKNINARLRLHVSDSHISHKTNWIKQLKVEKLKPIIQAVEYINEEEADWYESWWIIYGIARKWKLTNSTTGGRKHTTATTELKERLSKQRKGTRLGTNNPFYGKKHDKAARIKMSKHNKGRIKGENNPKNKLTVQNILEIRALAYIGVSSYKLEKLYNISKLTVNNIKTRKTWADLVDEPDKYNIIIKNSFSEDDVQKLLQSPRGLRSSPLTDQDIGELKFLLSEGHRGVNLTLIFYDVSRLYINKIKNGYIHASVEARNITF